MNSSSNTPTQLLCDKHSKILTVESRIHPKIIRDRGYYCSCILENSQQHLQELGYSNSFDSFMVIPLEDIAGNKTYQIRIDNPPGDYPKYLATPGSTNIIDIPPGTKAAAKNSATTLIITEGAKKADSINSALTSDLNAVAVSLSGVWNFRSKDNGVIADIDELGLKNRDVILAFDSDQIENLKVSQALFELHKVLEKRKAKVKSFIPGSDTGAKVGVDDFLAAASSDEDYRARAKRIITQAVEVVAPAEPIKFNMTTLAEATDEPLEYLLYPYLEKGHLSVLFGQGGVGKGLLSVHLALRLAADGIKVFWIDAEDKASDIKRRAKDAGNLENITIVDAVVNDSDAFNLSNPNHVNHLFMEMEKVGAKLLIVNTLTSFLSGTDSNNEAQIKSSLLYLTDKLDKYNISGLGIAHINKSTSYARANYRVQGSSAFTDLPRKVFGICMIPDETGQGRELRAVGVTKSNNDSIPAAAEYELVTTDDTPTIKATGLNLPHDFSYYLAEADRANTKMKEVKQAILEILEIEMDASDLNTLVIQRLSDHNISQPTYDRAIRELKDDAIISSTRIQNPNGTFVGRAVISRTNPIIQNDITEQPPLKNTEVNNRNIKIDDKEDIDWLN